MAANLLEAISDLVTPDVISRVAATFGEPEPAAAKGLGAVFPLLLGSLAHRASDGDLASSLFKLVRDPANDGSLLGGIGSLLGPGAPSHPMTSLGGRLLDLLYGANLGSLGNAIASYAGVKPASGGSLLRFAAPVVLALLGRSVKNGNLNAGSLASLLIGERGAYASRLPGPLSRLESYLAAPMDRTAVPPPPPPAPKSSVWRWLLPLIIVLVLLWLLSRCMGPKEPATTQVTPAPAPAVEPAPAPMPAPAATPSVNYYFEVDEFALPVARDGSLEAVVEYLMANPGSVAVVSGYHDPTGGQAHNEELAKQRAEAVKAALLTAGVTESQIDLVKPIETTGTGDLAEARRVEVSIRN